MKTFKLSNTINTEVTIYFEPVGDCFQLPAKEQMELLIFDEEAGLGNHSCEIVIGVENGGTAITIFAEKNKFQARYKGQAVNVM
ncbi:hypothetical protein [Chitinophaga rhizophila]|uniref:Uncharacterized protein n=1 Tax=Chitinophaga rhizophila TaxID=2866212 RepID=A0ABS7GAE3_9BACT|nr:hypothetical protein [Chitinophaga rhizophila]MBW8684633.1 hypothetical protein [Chitinophaga rhizophila]